MSDKEAYEKKYEAQIEEWRAELDQLKAKVKKASGEAEVKYRNKIDELEDKLEALKKSLD
ncbi:hypothetical protein [Pseudidiomarina sp.]|uniref:hypothetical protein n=1 Tax=Pseudidiomarina sp. TaxID=2081707 RepID=UPI00299E9B0A|nr:hypothetical protein [Pseudidiomarina sp.]MDX1705726.1 hypothetical protein [Pseudidiomarina sp.]